MQPGADNAAATAGVHNPLFAGVVSFCFASNGRVFAKELGAARANLRRGELSLLELASHEAWPHLARWSPPACPASRHQSLQCCRGQEGLTRDVGLQPHGFLCNELGRRGFQRCVEAQGTAFSSRMQASALHCTHLCACMLF